MFCVTSQQGTDLKKNVYLSIVHNFLSFFQLFPPVSMGRLQVTSARDAEHFWWLRMFHYLFVIPFPQGRRWWVWTIHYIWKQSTILGSVMQNKSRKKNQENSRERVKSWSQSKIAAQTLKITIDRTQRTALQPDVLLPVPTPLDWHPLVLQRGFPRLQPLHECLSPWAKAPEPRGCFRASEFCSTKVTGDSPALPHSLATLGRCQRRLSLGTLQSHNHLFLSVTLQGSLFPTPRFFRRGSCWVTNQSCESVVI